ncbi:hypothetical protein HZS55_12120 [Halosimplex rubrum]|uniref:Uncharacterized protein n=1 Tax=Halosimplex rubrum TaxID=869889 RepID=A0A7D5PB05_9EURY|nr:hypothetical protein [Halosimplex rubrum]QLH77999.1 hypothetical protein HZS55_12120 [Halosimplex rubrum]
MKTESGYVTEVECDCDSSETEFIEDIYSKGMERDQFCRHSAEAVVTIYSEFSDQIENEVRRIN